MFRRKREQLIHAVHCELDKSTVRIGKRMLTDIKARIRARARAGYTEFDRYHHYVTDGKSIFGNVTQEVMDYVQRGLEKEGFTDVSCMADKESYSICVDW